MVADGDLADPNVQSQLKNCAFEETELEVFTQANDATLSVPIPAGWEPSDLRSYDWKREASNLPLGIIGVESETAVARVYKLSGKENTANGHKFTAFFRRKKVL